MSKIAFLFSGQGSQYAGMGAELCAEFPQAREVYGLASDALGFDILKLSREGSEQELAKTAVSQPLIYTLSMAAYRVLVSSGITPGAVAGFSLGECSALTAAGAMELSTGFAVIKSRAAAMQAAAEQTGGAMYAVLGAKEEDILSACENAPGYATPVNYNCPGQIVIAGEENAAAAAAAELAGKGSRTVRLSVNAAFHSKLMQGASERFYEEIKGFRFKAPRLPVYSNLSGGPENITDVPGYLKQQMVSPVRFIEEMAAMSNDGFDAYVELGPGRTLCGFIRKGIRGARFYNVEDKSTLSKCLSALEADCH